MSLFGSIAVVLAAAAGGGVLAKVLRQPVLLGYLLAGVGLAATGFFRFDANLALVSGMGQLGVTLLLFLVGLELPIPALQKLGKVALVTGISQIAVTAILAYGLSVWLNYSQVAALFLAVALTFSSTIIVVKLLSEKGELESLHAKVALGSLLVQDFVAIGVLIILSGWSAGAGIDLSRLILTVIKGVGLTALTIWLSGRVFAPVFDWLGRSTEILFVTSVGWCLLVAAIAGWPGIGLGVEIGGFLAGLALANSASGSQIMARTRPLRDFFLTWFFVWLGASAGLGTWKQVWLDAAILSAFVLVVKPLLMALSVSALGFNRRVAFLSGVSLAQISEFSLVIIAAGVKLGSLPPEVLTLVTMIGIITMTLSSYLIGRSKRMYSQLAPIVSAILPSRGQAETAAVEWAGHAVLFGHRRTGRAVLPALRKLKLPTVVVDFDPKVVEDLTAAGVTAVYGDVADIGLHDHLNLDRAKLVISTVTDVEDNLALLDFTRRLRSRRPVVVVTAVDNVDAHRLYQAGADFVLVPHQVGGEYLAHILGHYGIDRKYMRSLHRQKGNLGGKESRV